MAINTTIWGSVSDWTKSGQVTSYDDEKDCIYMTSDYIDDIQTLSIGTPIDKTISFSGLGTESPYSHLKWFDVNELNAANADDKIYSPTLQDNRNVTNFSLSRLYDFGSPSYGQNAQFLVDGDETSRNTDPTQFRWSPTPATGEFSLIQPVTRFNYKNFLCCIYVRAGTSITGTYTTFDLDTYMSTGHITHPVIGSVFFMPYIYVDDVNQRITAWDTTGAPTYMHVAIIDNFNGLSTSPYSYGYFNCNGRWFMLLGGIVQNSSSIANGYNSIDCQTYTADNKKSYQGIVGGDEWYVWINRKGTDWIEGAVARDYSDTFYDECMAAMACFGYFFVTSETVAKDPDTKLTDDDVYCGVLDESLIGHGDYTHGVLNVRNPQWDWETSDDSEYDGNAQHDVDPNQYNGEMRTHDIPLFGSATERYNLSAFSTQLSLLPKLWDVMALADPDADKLSYSLDMFLASNPIDSIVSLQFLPVKDMGDYEEGHTVYLGKYNTGISARVAKTSIRYDCGDYEVYPVFGDNWIDREMQISLYLPFCGTINLEPETYINKTINVEYMIDLTTGTCSAVVSFSGDNGKRIITDVASGTCAIDLPVTGIQQQTLNSQLFNAAETTKQLKVNNSFKGFRSLMGAVSSLNGDAMGAINSMLGASQDIYNIFQGEKIADYNLHHTMLPTKMIGTSGALTGAMCELYPTIIFSRPTLGYNEDFAHCQGFACCITGVLTEYTGYTEIINPDLSGFTATGAEKEMIKSLLASGVYL